MPQHQQSFPVSQRTTMQILALSFGAFEHLGWTAEGAVESRLVGYTKKSWNRHHDHILIDAQAESLTVTSQLPDGTAWDLFRKNKKNVAKFLAAFAEVKLAATPEQADEWSRAVEGLQQETSAVLQKQEQERTEADAILHLSTGSRTLTYGLIGLNVLLFAIMAISGVGLFEPLIADLVKWGANYKPLTTGGEPWRLFTAMFIHIGIIHLLFNMYALYQAGAYLEPMLGKSRFLTGYLCTGVLSGVCSTWWHGTESVSAGASGAIFGMYGIFLALLTTKLIPESVRKALLQSIVVFVVYNLAYGFRSQAVDNAAHLGGFASGLAVGYLYFFTFRKPGFRAAIAMGVMGAATVLLSFSYLHAANNDFALYNKKVDEILAIQEKAMAPLKNYSSDADLLSKLASVSQAEWAKAKTLMDQTDKYQLDENLSKHRKLLKEYVDLRIKLNDLSIIALQGKENVDAEIAGLTKQINEKVTEMQNK